MKILTESEKLALIETAETVGTDPEWLYKLINFESGFNPFAKNPNSTARGLIQFIDDTARKLGYENSLDLVNKNPTVEQQIKGPVTDYLIQYRPLNTKEKLYLSVFYPRAIGWELDRPFPEKIQLDNPGIVTVRDYINQVEKKIDARAALIIALFVSGVLLYTLISK